MLKREGQERGQSDMGWSLLSTRDMDFNFLPGGNWDLALVQLMGELRW